jgi:hypothetical protein
VIWLLLQIGTLIGPSPAAINNEGTTLIYATADSGLLVRPPSLPPSLPLSLPPSLVPSLPPSLSPSLLLSYLPCL